MIWCGPFLHYLICRRAQENLRCHILDNDNDTMSDNKSSGKNAVFSDFIRSSIKPLSKQRVSEYKGTQLKLVRYCVWGFGVLFENLYYVTPVQCYYHSSKFLFETVGVDRKYCRHIKNKYDSCYVILITRGYLMHASWANPAPAWPAVSLIVRITSWLTKSRSAYDYSRSLVM